ncbi:MAG: 16S rRNA (guanine(966)-N(2))-methyltransferase RsmD [Bacilli bacterium]
MRIIGGIYRHRNIIFPSEKTTRPTKDRIRESLFSSLGESIGSKRVLDLFAGSGAYGIEALSRGASFCAFVDLENEPIKCIKSNLSTLKIENAKVIKSDYKNYLNTLQENSFDIVLLDPPYALDVCNDIVDLLINRNIIANDGIIIVETDKEFLIDESLFSKVKRFKYGFIHLTILRR